MITGEDWNVDFPTTDGERRTKSIIASMRQFYQFCNLGSRSRSRRLILQGAVFPRLILQPVYLAQRGKKAR